MSDRFYKQFGRCLETVRLLRGYRYGMTLQQINEELADRYPCHRKTTERDLQTLETLGEVERSSGRWTAVTMAAESSQDAVAKKDHE